MNLPTECNANIVELSDDEAANENADLGYRGRYNAVFIKDWGSTVPDITCDLSRFILGHKANSDYQLLARLELDEVEALIPLLKMARDKMVELEEKQVS
ncbi:hypothetical protein COB72_00970 [bacterium]|nr:MAG: hypothetical protein COB72_00970 [bacterium]